MSIFIFYDKTHFLLFFYLLLPFNYAILRFSIIFLAFSAFFLGKHLNILSYLSYIFIGTEYILSAVVYCNYSLY